MILPLCLSTETLQINFSFFAKHPLLETIVLKKPILSSDCPTGPREILDNGLGGLLFKKENYRDLAEKIVFFKNNKKEMIKKTKHAYKRLYRFDFRTNLEKYYKILTI